MPDDKPVVTAVPANKKKNEGNQAAEFVGMLLGLKKGLVAEEMGEEFLSVVQAVRTTRRPGALTVNFKIKYQPGTDESLDMVSIEVETKQKIPKPSTGTSTFFIGADGQLVRHHPRQMSMLTMEDS